MAKLMWVMQDVETKKYLRKTVRRTHTGEHIDIDWVDNINFANVVINEYGIMATVKGLKETVIGVRVVREVRLATQEDIDNV